jgi:uncharacterized protein
MIDNFFPSYFEWWHLPLLFVAGLIGESFGALIGGGSIVTLPALLFTGAPIQSAIAMNNSAALGTEAGILTETWQKVINHKKLVFVMSIPLILGGILGTWLLLNVTASIIKYLVVGAVIVILINAYAPLKKPELSSVSKSRYAALIVFLFITGVYTNFIAAGEGTFSKIGLMSILGLSFIQSQGIKSTATMLPRIYSLVITAVAGLIIWPYLLTKWCSNFLAGKYATKFAKKVPDSVMKAALTVMSIAFIMYLLFFY